METRKLYRGRLIDHLHLVTNELSASKRFYSAVLAALDIPLGGEGEGFFWADELFVSDVRSKASQGKATGRVHFAFQADNQERVQEFYRAGIEAGGTPNGEPGERPYHPGYYAAFLIDPDGNNVEAVFHGVAMRSSPAVELEF
ncbi:MAG: VOC family protein [Myxococcales bacterium]|jgi:catechol 2,3-dioxygenase-like lactoylglutathione lyase family enzyme